MYTHIMRSGQSRRCSSPNQAENSARSDQVESTSHPFVVRIWLEVAAHGSRGATWRGHITHVPSGERRYLRNLQDITTFIAPYLEEMGVKLGLLWQVRRWLD